MKLRFRPIARDTWAVYRAHWKVLIPLTVIVLLPQAVGAALIGEMTVDSVDDLKDALKLASIPLVVAVNLGGEALLAGIVAALVLSWRRGEPIESFAEAAREIPFGRLIAIDILFAVLVALGFVLLVIPGVLVFTYLLIAPALIEIEHVTVRESIRRSAALVRGSFWRVLGFAVIAFVLTDYLVALLETPLHGKEGEVLWNLGIEALIEPLVTVATVVLALALIDLQARKAP